MENPSQHNPIAHATAALERRIPCWPDGADRIGLTAAQAKVDEAKPLGLTSLPPERLMASSVGTAGFF